jgi:hypothetical protein
MSGDDGQSGADVAVPWDMSKTPFFKEFGSLSFDHERGRLRSVPRKAQSLDNLYGALGSLVDEQLLAPPAQGPGSRERKLTLAATFWAFVYLLPQK